MKRKNFNYLKESQGWECKHCGLWTHEPDCHEKKCKDIIIAEQQVEIAQLREGNNKLREQNYCSQCGRLFDDVGKHVKSEG